MDRVALNVTVTWLARPAAAAAALDAPEVEALAAAAVERALGGRLAGVVDIGVTFVDAAEIQRLNAGERGVDAPTDVLSFPIDDLDEELPEGMPRQLGDVAICPAFVEEQVAAGMTMVPAGPGQVGGDATLHEALRRCVVHGTLHLCGLDHELDPDAAREMFDLEQACLDDVPVGATAGHGAPAGDSGTGVA